MSTCGWSATTAIHCRPAAIGGIEVRGPNVFSGYWRRPELTPTEFTADGFFRTGDVGMFDADGYLHIVGRSKDLIISGGLNVYPKEVEDVIDAFDGRARVGGDRRARCRLRRGGGGGAGGRAAARRSTPMQCARTLANIWRAFKVPKQVHVVDALPRNAMGKVEKAALRRTFGSSS